MEKNVVPHKINIKKKEHKDVKLQEQKITQSDFPELIKKSVDKQQSNDVINYKDKLNTVINKNIEPQILMTLCVKLYEKAYSGLDIMNLLENTKFSEEIMTIEKKYELLLAFHRVRKEFRNEKLLILFILNFIFLSSEITLENISFM
jgi:hypothetical protein